MMSGGYCRLIAIQVPTQPSDRLNVPEPLFSDNCPTAVSVIPPPAPTECNVPSGSTIPPPPRTMILPCRMVAGSEPVCEHPALVKIHLPSKSVPLCSGVDDSSRRVERNAILVSLAPATAGFGCANEPEIGMPATRAPTRALAIETGTTLQKAFIAGQQVCYLTGSCNAQSSSRYYSSDANACDTPVRICSMAGTMAQRKPGALGIAISAVRIEAVADKKKAPVKGPISLVVMMVVVVVVVFAGAGDRRCGDGQHEKSCENVGE